MSIIKTFNNKKLNNGETLTISVYLIGIFLVAEAFGGILANSLTILADAGHMFSDFLAILLSLVAYKFESKPADNKRSFGYSRMQIIASFINGTTLVVISIVITITAIVRMFDPPVVEADMMLIIAILGMIINGITLWILQMSEEKNLNMQGAILHVIGDFLGSISAVVGAIIIKYTGWYIVDPILSILIGCLILNSAIRIIKRSMHILMEGAPDDLKEQDIKNSLMIIKGVVDVQHIHIWLLNDHYTITTLHLILQNDCDPFNATLEAQKILNQNKKIQHSTIAVERYYPEYHINRHYDHHHADRD
jgi:cobalt-zinc-cadmium efflux system protein